MGLFAMPLTLNEFLSLGFAWGSWGEFSFILAVRALRGNLLSGSLVETCKVSRVSEYHSCHSCHFPGLWLSRCSCSLLRRVGPFIFACWCTCDWT